MTKKIEKNILCILVIIFLIAPFAVFAQETFIALSPIPGVTDTKDLGKFLNAAFKIGLAIAGTLAVVMITIGGLQYMTTDSISGKGEGRSRIQDAIIGLLLALLIFIILNTINPSLLNLDPTIPQLKKGDAEALEYKSPSQTNGKGGTGLSEQEKRREQEKKLDKNTPTNTGTVCDKFKDPGTRSQCLSDIKKETILKARKEAEK